MNRTASMNVIAITVIIFTIAMVINTPPVWASGFSAYLARQGR